MLTSGTSEAIQALAFELVKANNQTFATKQTVIMWTFRPLVLTFVSVISLIAVARWYTVCFNVARAVMVARGSRALWRVLTVSTM